MIWRKIAYFWMTPSSFKDNWRKYALNQIGHFVAVGVLPAALLGILVVPVTLLAYFAWELTQWQFRRADASDCVEDWAFVACGAFLGATGNLAFLLVACAFLVAGIFWRVEQWNS